MAKIILLALGLLLVYWLLKGYRRRIDRSGSEATRASDVENMVRCARCGVHLPRSESITSKGSFYCSAEHQQNHQAERQS